MKRVIYKKVINENKENRTEFLLINFDYEDGNDYLAKIFNKEFNMKVEEKKDYIWFTIIKLCKKNTCYELLWHEDIGNIIYSLEQDEDTVNELELRLQKVLDVLNIKILESN
ncbi:AraC family transcriptional regulator [Fusobacterium polymorphum]|uniref:AraC family transcriptional regulator n=1 Tax=Fusobacterium nucleatum subsp. polymorphum TaxID=76857 RepID=UPI00300BC01A